MLELDGSAGGGQLVRTALSLSALSGRAFRMTGIRAERPEPGLRPQHLAAVRALATITDADVSGATEGSETLRFQPETSEAGRYEVDVGTAGSVTLLFDALLPLSVNLEGPLVLRARGGTDVRWAPTMDYLRRVKLPLLRRHGVGAAVDLGRRGFYPVGGGLATLSLFPSSPERFDLVSAPSPEGARVFSVASTSLAGREVAERQASAAVDGLSEGGVSVDGYTVEYADTASPGSAIAISLDLGTATVGGDALGERGTPAEDVAERAVSRAMDPLDAGAVLDAHLADQLLVFLALAGGRVSVSTVSDHVRTARSVLGAFGYEVEIAEDGEPPTISA